MYGSINGVVKVTTHPKGPTRPDLKYQTSSQHSDNQSNPHDDITRSDCRDTGITTAFSMHYTTSPTHCGGGLDFVTSSPSLTIHAELALAMLQ
jgi:hypothetical protein